MANFLVTTTALVAGVLRLFSPFAEHSTSIEDVDGFIDALKQKVVSSSHMCVDYNTDTCIYVV